MRAQQAFTVLPYDAFLFMAIQLVLAAQLGVEAGPYMHFAGTFHMYEAEEYAVRQTLDSGVKSAAVPLPPAGAQEVSEFVSDLVAVESRFRAFAEAGDLGAVRRRLGRPGGMDLAGVACRVLGSFALGKLGAAEEAVEVVSELPQNICALC